MHLININLRYLLKSVKSLIMTLNEKISEIHTYFNYWIGNYQREHLTTNNIRIDAGDRNHIAEKNIVTLTKAF